MSRHWGPIRRYRAPCDDAHHVRSRALSSYCTVQWDKRKILYLKLRKLNCILCIFTTVVDQKDLRVVENKYLYENDKNKNSMNSTFPRI